MDTSEPDLSLVHTRELIDELFNRFDFLVITGQRSDYKPGVDRTTRLWQGDSDMCAGLCARILYEIHDTGKQYEKDVGDD